ncbi:MAG TPA: acireductone synthase [Pirellulaceae bacterium]|nr:acireductone synthase [Pirellulaceae bacterium]
MATRCLLLDIEGTTSSIQFVHNEMFPFARRELEGYIESHWGEAELEGALDELAREAGFADRHAWLSGIADSAARQRIMEFVLQLMDRDAKVTGLKQLQGLVWRGGFETGNLQAHLFDDVPGALKRWRDAGLEIRIYSSGSVESQQLFFGHTIAGNLLPLFSGHYDTRVGGKREVASYLTIARDIGLPPDEIVFVSDVEAELEAAQTAGLQAVLSVRPGNADQPGSSRFPVICSFDQLQIRTPGDPS